jgi:hypothetical protein
MSDLSLSNSAVPATSHRSFWCYLEKPITGLLLTLALSLIAEGFPIVEAHGAELPEVADRSTSEVINEVINVADQSMLNRAIFDQSTFFDLAQFNLVSQRSLPNGTYVFGQSPEADQVGSTYLVFEVSNEQIVGAFYMPSSSFDCFYGEPQVEYLALTVVNSDDRSEYTYNVELQRDTNVATVSNSAIAPLRLTGYHQLDTVGPNDYRILAACRTAHLQ